MAKYADSLDLVLRALSDPTRRSVVARLTAGPATVGELSGHFDMALPSFVKHVRQLEAAGLVATHKSGRVRICSLERQSFQVIETWMDEQQRLWEERADRLQEFVTTDEMPTPPTKNDSFRLSRKAATTKSEFDSASPLLISRTFSGTLRHPKRES